MENNVKDMFEKAKVSVSRIANKTTKVAVDVADVAGKKAGEVIESTKLNMKIFDLNTELEILYKDLGKIYFNKHQGMPYDDSDIEDKILFIEEKLIQKEVLGEKVAGIKSAIVCNHCESICSKGDQFCKFCGSQI